MVYIGIDYGRKRTGFAISISGVVMPLEPLSDTTWKKIDSRIHSIINEHGTSTVVLGLPLTAGGKETELSCEVEELADYLRNEGHIVELVRETGTTVEAQALRKNKRRDGKMDSIAAVIILKRYLGLA